MDMAQYPKYTLCSSSHVTRGEKPGIDSIAGYYMTYLCENKMSQTHGADAGVIPQPKITPAVHFMCHSLACLLAAVVLLKLCLF